MEKKKLITIVVSEETSEDADEVIDADQVSVLVLSLDPRHAVVQSHAVAQVTRLTEVYHPDTGLLRRVVHEQQGAADHLRATTQTLLNEDYSFKFTPIAR